MGSAALPSGTVTFLALEIDDAGDLWDRDPDAMEVVCERLDGIASTLVETRRGRMLPTESADRMLAVFANPSVAVTVALELGAACEVRAVAGAARGAAPWRAAHG